MKRSWMTAMLVTIITGIVIIPVMVQAGGYHVRRGWEGPRYIVSSTPPYSSAGYAGSYAREEQRTIYRAPDVYQSAQTPYPKPCTKSVRVKPHKSGTARMIQKTTVIIDCQKAASVKPIFKPKKSKPVCFDPYSRELERVKAELRAKDLELRKAEVELATWREREKAQKAYDSKYAEWYKEFQAWQARRPK